MGENRDTYRSLSFVIDPNKPKILRMKFIVTAFVLACTTCGVQAHADGCNCGTASVVCQKHQWMFWGILGLMLTYLYMYAGYLFQSFCQTEKKDHECDECGHHHCSACSHDDCCDHFGDVCNHSHGHGKSKRN